MREGEITPRRLDTWFRNPRFWERNVVYFANLKSLFFGNQAQTDELAGMVGEIDSYGGRLASVLNLIYRGGDNLLVLERPPEASLLRYFEGSLGLSLPRIETMPLAAYQSVNTAVEGIRQALPKGGTVWIDGYVTDETLSKWARALSAPTLSSEAGSRSGNNKTKLYQFLMETNLPTPATRLADSDAEARESLQALKRAGFRRAVVRAALGASGIGMVKIDLAEAERAAIPDTLFHEGPALVQGWLEPGIDGIVEVRSPSVQLFLDEDTVHMYDITDQILSADSIHEGNHSPPFQIDEWLREELIRQAGEAGSWLHRQGYRGTASVDFLVVEKRNTERPVVYVCEVNARITGATYPSTLARHLAPGSAWLLRNLRLEEPVEGARLLELIYATRLLFERGAARGVVPINFNFGQDGQTRKGQFLCLAPSVEECRELLQNLVDTLPLKTRPERD